MRSIIWFVCCQRCSHCEQADETALGREQTCPSCDGALMLHWSVLLFVPGDRYPRHRDFVALLYRPPRCRTALWHVGYTTDASDKAMTAFASGEQLVAWWQDHLVAITPTAIAG